MKYQTYNVNFFMQNLKFFRFVWGWTISLVGAVFIRFRLFSIIYGIVNNYFFSNISLKDVIREKNAGKKEFVQ